MRLSFAILPLSAAVLLSACGSAPKKTEPTPPPPTTNKSIASMIRTVTKKPAHIHQVPMVSIFNHPLNKS